MTRDELEGKIRRLEQELRRGRTKADRYDLIRLVAHPAFDVQKKNKLIQLADRRDLLFESSQVRTNALFRLALTGAFDNLAWREVVDG